MGPLVGSNELSKSLVEAGNNLLNSLSSTDSTLTLLDEIESLLTTVEQDPAVSVKKALIPSMEALRSANLLRNTDSDVRVSVVSCLTEIMRITAPEAPYGDETMKEIFEVTIEAFDKLADASGRSYKKAEAVLDTVSKVRSSLVMLDLECDGLILEMFRQFLKLIRPDHPPAVPLAMETIMNTILDESEEISSDLVDILLASVKKDSQDVSPTATNLVEKVLNACASKLKPCIMDALKSPRASFDLYSPVVLSICEREYPSTLAHDVVEAKEDEAVEKKYAEQVVPSDSLEEKLDLVPSSKGNGFKKTLRISGHKAEDDGKSVAKQGKSESTDAETESGSTGKRGRRPNSRMNPEEGYSFKTSSRKKAPEKEIADSSLGKLAAKKASLAKVGETKLSVVISLSSSDRTKTGSRKRSRNKMEETNPDIGSLPTPRSKKQIVKKDYPPEEDLSESSLERSEEVKTAKSSKKQRTQNGLAKTSAKKPLAETKMVTTSEKKTVHTSAQKKNSKGASTDTSIPQSPKSKKKNSLAKVSLLSKESEQTLKSNPKRKRTAGEEVESGKEFGVELVGKRVKVWWPLDKEFYEGVIKSYCKSKKTHKVLYADGESEDLNLKEERWEIIQDNSSASEDKKIDSPESILLADFIKTTKAKKSKNASKNVELSSSPEVRCSVQTKKKKDSVTNSTKQVKGTKGAPKVLSNEPESSEVKNLKSVKQPNAKRCRTTGRKRQRITRAGQPGSDKDIDVKEEAETKGEDSKRDHRELPEEPKVEPETDGGEVKTTKEPKAEPETDGEEREVAKEPSGEPKTDGEEQKVAKEPTAEPKTDADEHKSVKETKAEPETEEEEQKPRKESNAEAETEGQEEESAKEETEDTKLIEKEDMSK